MKKHILKFKIELNFIQEKGLKSADLFNIELSVYRGLFICTFNGIGAFRNMEYYTCSADQFFDSLFNLKSTERLKYPRYSSSRHMDFPLSSDSFATGLPLTY